MKRLVGVLLLAPMLIARADEVDDMKAAGAPDDIIAIMRKMKAGTSPSMEDLAKIRAWQKGIAGRVNSGAPQNGSQFGPKQAGAPEGIRVRLEFHTTLHETGPGDSIDLETDGTADAMMYAAINGSDDYRKSVLDPNVKASSFRFEPIMANNQLVKSGAGHFSFKEVTKNCRETISATYAWTTFSSMFVTTGRDDHLLALGGGYGGTLNGTDVGCYGSNTWHEHDFGGPGNVQLPFVEETHATDHPPAANAPTPASKFTLSYAAMVKAIGTGKTEKVTGIEPFDLDLGQGMHASGTSTLELTLRPSDVQLVIEPTDLENYKDWVPLPDLIDGGGDAKLFGDPKPLSIHVVMARRPNLAGTTKPDATTPGKIEMSLDKVSTNTGIAMNFPELGKGDNKSDLFFLPQIRQPAGIKVIDETHAETMGLVTEATVLVAARDTGAFGLMTAQVKTLKLTSTNPRNSRPAFEVPIDDNDNHIADKWEREQGIFDKALEPDWDEEDVPKEWKESKGDDLSLFDSYRGVIAGHPEALRRISPNQRSLFIFAKGLDKDIYEAGGAMYAKASGVAVYTVQSESRLAPSKDQGDTFPRWITFNKTPYTAQKSYAVWIVDIDKPWGPAEIAKEKAEHPNREGARNTDGSVPVGNTHGTLDDDRLYPGGVHMTPKTTSYINVSRKDCTEWLTKNNPWEDIFKGNAPMRNAAIAIGVDPDAAARQLVKGASYPTLVNEFLVLTVTHELGHATGAKHHAPEEYSGDTNCPMLYFHLPTADDHTEFVRFLFSKWDPSAEGPNNHKMWRFGSEESRMTIKPYSFP